MRLLKESTFDHSVMDFKKFLRDQGMPTDLQWIFQEDVRTKRNMILVNSTNLDLNAGLAENLYELGRERGLGVCFQAIGRTGSQLYCYVELPRDAEESERLLVDGSYMKFSLRRPLLEVFVCANVFIWCVKTLASEYLREPPSRRQESW